MTDQLQVLITAPDHLMPSYAHPGDAGADLRASHDGSIPPGGRLLVKTGVSIALPAGYVALVHPRSGLAAKFGVTVLNAPGTVDAGYRGEIMVTLHNTSTEEWSFLTGDRIAQLVIQKYEHANFVLVEKLPGSERGESGFGSTGVR
jgi:dUTP pyrophosphatase